MGSYDILLLLLVIALLVGQAFILRFLVQYGRCVRQTKQLYERIVELAEQSTDLQKETNRLLKRIVFEEDDDNDAAD